MTFFRSCGDILTELGHSQVRLSKLCWQSAAFTQASIYKVLFTLMMFCWCARSHTTVQPVACILSSTDTLWLRRPGLSLQQHSQRFCCNGGNCCHWFFDFAKEKDLNYLPWRMQDICLWNNETFSMWSSTVYVKTTLSHISDEFIIVLVIAISSLFISSQESSECICQSYHCFIIALNSYGDFCYERKKKSAVNNSKTCS